MKSYAFEISLIYINVVTTKFIVLEGLFFHCLLTKVTLYCFQVPNKRFDKQIKDAPKIDFENLKFRRRFNNRLERMKSIRKMPERALSWAESDSDLCRARSNNQRAGRTQKAMTVDCSPMDGDKSFDTSLVNQTIPEDEVFEKEHGAEHRPLLKDDTDSKEPNPDEQSKQAAKKLTHDALHRQDAVDNIPQSNVHVQRAKSE